MVNLKNLKTILWCPSGGLGHCLHNLDWAFKLSQKYKTEFYIYGLNLHKPYQEYYNDTLKLLKDVKYTEITDEKELKSFLKKYQVNEKGVQFIKKRGYRTGKKFLDDKKSTLLICCPQGRKLNYLTFKPEYVEMILNDPYKYYKNDYNLCSPISNTKIIICKKFTFEIGKKCSYRLALGVNNNKLHITKDDKEYYRVKKELIINYINTNKKKKTKICLEGKIEKIEKIASIESATYGVKDRNIDVTNKVIKMLEPVNVSKTTNTTMTTNEQKTKINDILKNEKYIAVHYRGRDKSAAGGVTKKISEIKSLINKTKIKNIFVATDNCNFFKFLEDELDKSIFIFRYTSPPKEGKNIHYNTTTFTKGENLYKTVLDIYTCRNAAHFIPSINSGFSKLVKELK